MKGVILAGGTGSRLFPLTKVTNKHLLPVYNAPMIYYPLWTLVNAGIEQILIVTGGRNAGDFLRLLANGKEFGLKRLNYAYQEGEGGIADALRLAEDFAEGERICVILGDNILEGSIKQAAEKFVQQPHGAHILLKEVSNPERFGVPVFDGDRITRIEEKPASRPAILPSPGFTSMTQRYSKRPTLKPSHRGELEITDVNNAYLREGTLTHSLLEGWWTDAGTFESLRLATNLVADGMPHP